jgi:hypothetical protein
MRNFPMKIPLRVIVKHESFNGGVPREFLDMAEGMGNDILFEASLDSIYPMLRPESRNPESMRGFSAARKARQAARN